MKDCIHIRKKYLGTFDNHFSTIGLIGMNEAGLNAKWLRADMTHEKTQEFAKNVLNHMRERLRIIRKNTGISTIWRRHRQNPQRIVLQNMTEINSRISSQRRKTVERLIIRIVPTSRLDTQKIFLRRLIYRMRCRYCILQELFFMHF